MRIETLREPWCRACLHYDICEKKGALRKVTNTIGETFAVKEYDSALYEGIQVVMSCKYYAPSVEEMNRLGRNQT